MSAALYSLGLWVLMGMALVAVPVFTIWAVNLLTGMSIPITFFTWLSTAWLLWLSRGSITVGGKDATH